MEVTSKPVKERRNTSHWGRDGGALGGNTRDRQGRGSDGVTWSHAEPLGRGGGGGRDMYQVRHYLRNLQPLVHTAFSADTQLT